MPIISALFHAAGTAATLAAATRPFFERHLPAPLIAEGPRGLQWWQWLAVPAFVVLALAAGVLLGWITRRVLGHLSARTRTAWDDEILGRISRPLVALWAVAVFGALAPWLDLGPGGEGAVRHLLRAATYLALFWAAFRSVDVAFEAARAAATKRGPSLAGLLPLGRKISKVVLLALGLVAVLNELGFKVASLLAGLGIGGIAVALAAQKTVENLFGSVAIGVDQPFRVGDFVKIEDFAGTVESIGMRSTRIRTPDRTLITIPNGRLADMRSETFAVRDRLRLFVSLGLSHATTSEQMKAVLSGIEAALREHPKIWPDSVAVRFTGIMESTLNVDVGAYLDTLDGNEFGLIRQDLLLRFMEIVERAGTTLAYPTRTVHLVEDTGRRR